MMKKIQGRLNESTEEEQVQNCPPVTAPSTKRGNVRIKTVKECKWWKNIVHEFVLNISICFGEGKMIILFQLMGLRKMVRANRFHARGERRRRRRKKKRMKEHHTLLYTRLEGDWRRRRRKRRRRRNNNRRESKEAHHTLYFTEGFSIRHFSQWD